MMNHELDALLFEYGIETSHLSNFSHVSCVAHLVTDWQLFFNNLNSLPLSKYLTFFTPLPGTHVGVVTFLNSTQLYKLDSLKGA